MSDELSRLRQALFIVAAFTAAPILCASAQAQPPEPFAPAPLPPPKQVSLTLSPLHLLFPMVEITGELRAGDRIGVAVIGGVGSVSSLGRSFTVYEVGGQLNVYLLESFTGLHIGAEAVYVGISNNDARVSVKSGAEGLAVGPLVGYKLATVGGFTFLAQGGVQYLAARAEATDTSTGQSASDEDSTFLPLLNLNVGWSF